MRFYIDAVAPQITKKGIRKEIDEADSADARYEMKKR